MRKSAVSPLHCPDHFTFGNLALFLFWPFFYLTFTYAEYFFPAAHYYPMHCRLDDLLPFCEWFILPYLAWFPFVGILLAYLFFRNISAFRRMMYFIILTYSAALLVFFLFPTCQHLRPAVFPRQNILTEWVSAIYSADTSTNVCPSIHVIGSLAVWFAAKDAPGLPRLLRRILIPVTSVLICVSTALRTGRAGCFTGVRMGAPDCLPLICLPRSAGPCINCCSLMPAYEIPIPWEIFLNGHRCAKISLISALHLTIEMHDLNFGRPQRFFQCHR